MNTLAEKVFFYRQRRDWSQQELAEKAGIRQSIICKIEKGSNMPRADTLKKIAEALGVPIGKLLDEKSA